MVPDPAAEVPPFYKNWRCVLGLALVMGVNVIWEVLNDVPAIWDMAYHQLMGLSYLQAWRAGTDQRQIEFPQRRLEIPTQGLKKKSCSRPLRRPFPRSSFL